MRTQSDGTQDTAMGYLIGAHVLRQHHHLDRPVDVLDGLDEAHAASIAENAHQLYLRRTHNVSARMIQHKETVGPGSSRLWGQTMPGRRVATIRETRISTKISQNEMRDAY